MHDENGCNGQNRGKSEKEEFDIPQQGGKIIQEKIQNPQIHSQGKGSRKDKKYCTKSV